MEILTGVLSEGTMRDVDLLETYADTLRWFFNKGTMLTTKENRELLETAYNRLQYLNEIGESQDPEEETSWILEEIDTELNSYLCERGFWFGTHPDDPACIGIWEENMEEM